MTSEPTALDDVELVARALAAMIGTWDDLVTVRAALDRLRTAARQLADDGTTA
jgi:hypothetical protein